MISLLLLQIQSAMAVHDIDYQHYGESSDCQLCVDGHNGVSVIAEALTFTPTWLVVVLDVQFSSSLFTETDFSSNQVRAPPAA